MIVSIEGIDKAGKRTLTAGLAELAVDAGIQVSTISFPRYGRSVTSASISAILAADPEPSIDNAKVTAALFAADRLEAVQILREFEDSDALLLADRYVHSNMAYQAARCAPNERERMATWVEQLEFGHFELPIPDLAILIDVKPDTSMARSRPQEGGRPSVDAYEANARLQGAAREIYLQMSRDHRNCPWGVVETSRESTPEVTAKQVWSDWFSALVR